MTTRAPAVLIMMRLANNHVENFDYIDERMENNQIVVFVVGVKFIRQSIDY